MMSHRRYSTSPARARATSSGKFAIPSDSATSCSARRGWVSECELDEESEMRRDGL